MGLGAAMGAVWAFAPVARESHDATHNIPNAESPLPNRFATREQPVTMLAVWRKPPGEEPEGSRPSAMSLVVHVVLRSLSDFESQDSIRQQVPERLSSYLLPFSLTSPFREVER
jgi:hypothetical protein